MTYLVLGEFLDHYGTDHATEGPKAVADAHEDAGVARGDVQVVDVETWEERGEPGETGEKKWLRRDSEKDREGRMGKKGEGGKRRKKEREGKTKEKKGKD